jgi:hypothetical protein
MSDQDIAGLEQWPRVMQADAFGGAVGARDRRTGRRGNQGDQGIEGVGHRRAIVKGAAPKA